MALRPVDIGSLTSDDTGMIYGLGALITAYDRMQRVDVAAS